jgi:hypothetical protein
VLVAPFWRGQHDKSVGSIRDFFVWNSELRNATMPQLVKPHLGRMYAGRGHTTPSSENDVVINKCHNLHFLIGAEG